MDLSCFSVSCKQGHWMPLFWSLFSRIFVYWTALQGRDSVFLSKGQVASCQDNDSLLCTCQGGSLPLTKDLSFPNLGCHSCSTTPPVPESPGPVCITLWELSWGNRKYWPADCYYCSVRNKKVLYLLPQSLSSAAAIPNLSVCKTVHSSWQSHILKVHSDKMHNNQKEQTGRCHINQVINVKISSNGIYCRHMTPGMMYWEEYISLCCF